ncbi:hypothetical protein BDP55DRAFT_636456 [Colletotrichum godetiae]|uniref:Uncharacterized protein n=1 Tax=Colletotrichum godetiae TaxID=1209918 RepID=A0AAJ0EPQ4_9PEZI|nr:uncharacterized protein BDP55DRAFT_636456 [Colletotrichum godetiae]KAK1659971.1 hypothetical protein BDP55DRAFT_636456 [Colletotrichum godetiae]
MAFGTALCEHCSLIDFEYLRHPTAAEIESLNTGQRPTEDRFPLKFGRPIDGDPSWTLGRTSRMNASAATLEDELKKLADAGLMDPLCYATCDIAGALQPRKGTTWEWAQHGETNPEFIMRQLAIYFIPFDKNSSNGLKPVCVGFKEASWKGMFHCFQTYDAERPQGSSNVQNFFEKTIDPGDILFTGRKRPSKLDRTTSHRVVLFKTTLETNGPGLGAPQVQPVRGFMPVFRLIDVNTMAIVEHKDVHLRDIDYMNLSYVWGTTPQEVT